MYGRILNTIINVMFITYLLLLVSFYFLHESIKDNINDINYSTLDTIAISGVFTEDMYNNLKDKILQYGGGKCDYELTVKYERRIGPGKYETRFLKDTVNSKNTVYLSNTEGQSAWQVEQIRKQMDPYGIITTATNKSPMYKGDRVTIYIEDKNQTLYGKLISMSFMGMEGSKRSFKITSLKSTVVGRDATDVVKGIDVISEVRSSSGYPIYLMTEMSNGSKYQINGGNPYNESNYPYRYVGSTLDPYHIFSVGNYYRSDLRSEGLGVTFEQVYE